MTELYGEDKPVDLVTLQERLKNKDVPPELTSVEFYQRHFKRCADFSQCRLLCEDCGGKGSFAPHDKNK